MIEAVTRYTIDGDRSRVWIDARSSLHPIHSEATGLHGWLEAAGAGRRVDLDHAPQAHLEMAVQQLSSGNPLYDREMRRRIDARRHPSISGDLTGMEQTGQDGSYRVTGTVTFMGRANSYTDEMTVSFGAEDTIELEGSHRFDVRDFGMQPPRILTLKVHPEVDVRVSVVARADREG